MKKIALVLAFGSALTSINVNADGYQHGWKIYEKPQPGSTYGGYETNPYGSGGSQSYGPGGGNSYDPGGGKNPSNPWRVAD